MSTLVGTLAWDNDSRWAFKEAIDSFELALCQVIHHLWDTTGMDPNVCIASTLRKFTLVEDKIAQMVYGRALMLGGSWVVNDVIELNELSSCCQFFFRLSECLAIANNMHPQVDINITSHSILECPNVNSLWASMIVEECSRLGLTLLAPDHLHLPLLLLLILLPLAFHATMSDHLHFMLLAMPKVLINQQLS